MSCLLSNNDNFIIAKKVSLSRKFFHAEYVASNEPALPERDSVSVVMEEGFRRKGTITIFSE
jgi:hypothetical protein